MNRPVKHVAPLTHAGRPVGVPGGIGPALLALSLLLAGSTGCGAAAGGGGECSVGADCASGACQAGRCVAGPGGTGGAAGGNGGASGAAGQPSDAGPGGTSGSGGSAGAGTGGSGGSAGDAGCATACCPNQDGVIERKEVPLMAGLSAKFEAAENAPVDTAGTTAANGSRVWDLSGKLPGDHLALVATQSLAGTWYAKDYPGASYASRLSDTQSLLGVFQITSDALLLVGVVSPSSGLTRTQLKYAPPVTVLSFPLKMGKTWTTTSNVTGLAQGLAANYTEKYVYKVDAHGTMKTPFADFPVLRTGVVLTRSVGLVTTTVRTYLFTTECFGTIASIVSKDNESNAEFTSAAEVQRLTP